MNRPGNASAKYRIDANNRLVVNQEVSLDGTWSLSDNHELCLTLNTTKDTGSGNKVVLDGTIRDVAKNSLLFEVAEKQDNENLLTEIIALTGTWQADRNNKLIFKVQKENGRNDILTFNNTWIIDDNHRIVYEYEKADLIRKKKETKRLVFKGYWNITNDYRLYYELDQESKSGFMFNVGAAEFEKNRIKYKIMIGKNSEEKNVTIGGEWKINRDFGLTFEVDYGENEIKPISIGGQWDLSKQDTLSVKMNSGLEVKIDHTWLDGDGKAFIKYHQGLEGNKVDWVIGWKF